MIIRSQPQSKTYNLSIKFKAHFFYMANFLKTMTSTFFRAHYFTRNPNLCGL